MSTAPRERDSDRPGAQVQPLRGEPKTMSAPQPRGQRVMAAVRWAMLAAVTLLAAFSVWRFWLQADDTNQVADQDGYYCPMHPDVRASAPGECPICHMDLEPIPQDRKTGAASPANADADADDERDAYYCPMHPEVRSHDPGECPICHMHLEPIPEDRSATGDAHSSVEQVVAVEVPETKQAHVGISTSAVQAAAVRGSLRVPGVLSAPETGLAQVRTRAPGFIERVLVNQSGERVKRGQILAYIYSPDIYRAQDEFLTAKRWDSQRGDKNADAARTIAAAARRSLELLGLTRADIDALAKRGEPLRAVALRSPSPGYVTRFNAVLGSRADAETVLYEIADLSTLWIIASVHERDATRIRVGMPAQFVVGGDGNGSAAAPLAAKVSLIEPLLDESVRQSRVRLTLDNRDNAWRPGQYGEVSFDLGERKGLYVPRDAVIDTGLARYVYVQMQAERFEPRAVQTGRASGEDVEIVSGLSAGERVVTRGSFMLDSESRLRASIQATEPAPAAHAQPEARDSEHEHEQTSEGREQRVEQTP